METKCIEKQRGVSECNNTKQDILEDVEDRITKKTRNTNLDLAYASILKKPHESDNIKHNESECKLASNNGSSGNMINVIELSSLDIKSIEKKSSSSIIDNFNENGKCPKIECIECSVGMEFEEFEVLSDQPYDSLNTQ